MAQPFNYFNPAGRTQYTGSEFENAYNREQGLQLQQLQQRYAQGDKSALNDIAAISPDTAQKLVNLEKSQQPAKPAEVNFDDLRGELQVIRNMAAQGSPMLPNALQQTATKYQGTGFDNDLSSWAGQYQQDPQAAIAELDENISALKQPKDSNSTSDLDSFEGFVKAANISRDEVIKAARIELGLDPRAVGSSIQTIAGDPNKLNAVAEASARIVGREETAKLISRLQLEPELQGRLKDAVAKSAAQAKASAEQRSNEKAFSVYNNAVGALTDALGQANTGSLVGLLPAFTSSDKIADGAIAIMRPVIKDAVRGAGEGTFTDQDQKLIDQMIPARTDSPEAISAKLSMLDSFMQSKLGGGAEKPAQGEAAQKQGRAESDILSQYGLE